MSSSTWKNVLGSVKRECVGVPDMRVISTKEG